MGAEFTSRSAAITSFSTEKGQELSLKFDKIDHYSHPGNRFLGASIGRYANRIYGSKINVAGQEWPLEVSVSADAAEGTPDITLHGGPLGWDKTFWEGPEKVTRSDGKQSTVFTHKSAHLDQGFPGEVIAKAIYTSYVENGKTVLELEYEVKLTEDSPVDETVVSMTNHNFFNIAPEGSLTIAGTEAKVNSNKYLIHDPKTSIPTGETADFPAIPENLEFTLTEEGPAIDHCFVVQPEKKFKSIDTRSDEAVKLISLYNPKSGVHLDILSTEPVYQIYTTDKMDIPHLSGEKRGYGRRAGIAVEPARYTNAVNMPEWRPWVVLKKGETYGSKIVYINWVD